MEAVQNPASETPLASSMSHVALDAALEEYFAGTVDEYGARVLLGGGKKPCSKRTLERHIANGLSYMGHGASKRFVVARMREHMMARERSRSRAPRPAGRPSRKPPAEATNGRSAQPSPAPSCVRQVQQFGPWSGVWVVSLLRQSRP